MNTVLIMLQDYLPIRNSCLLVRDNVINKYFIELAPEISEADKNQWNQKVSTHNLISTLKLQHGMVLYADEEDFLQLPSPRNLLRGSTATIIQPIVYKQQSLPLCVLSLVVTSTEKLNKIEQVVTSVGDMFALAMIAKGFPTTQIQEYHHENLQIPMVLKGIIGESESLREMAGVVKKVAASKATVLVRGESGTGKELIAKALHNRSLRRKASFIGVNCAALSENLLESELFGHEKGAFTGATGMRKGRFELADGGTLFLDEIGDTSISFQAKILRVLQEGQFERIGGNKTICVDVRIVCATNANLEEAIQQGNFREDLYYRLNVISISVPPLRNRLDDLKHLINYFLNKLNSQSNKHFKISNEDIEKLLNYDWPGNVRELENTIHSAFLMESNGLLNFTDKLKGFNLSPSIPKPAVDPRPRQYAKEVSSGSLENDEMEAIEFALQKTKGVQIKAAKMLGISLRQLRYRISKYQIIVRKIQHIS